MRDAEQRRSRARQAAETSVAAAQDSHTHQTALQFGHRALPVPEPDPGEAATRTEEAPHVLALLVETVMYSPTEVSKLYTGFSEKRKKSGRKSEKTLAATARYIQLDTMK